MLWKYPNKKKTKVYIEEFLASLNFMVCVFLRLSTGCACAHNCVPPLWITVCPHYFFRLCANFLYNEVKTSCTAGMTLEMSVVENSSQVLP